MQTRLTFQCLRRAIEASLVCPASRDALEQLARYVPSGTGPQVDQLDSILFVDECIWRFRTAADARRFAELVESYFRCFDPHYRVSAAHHPAEAVAGMNLGKKPA